LALVPSRCNEIVLYRFGSDQDLATGSRQLVALQWVATTVISGYAFVDIRISSEDLVPLYIKDDMTAHLVAELAKLRGVSKQDAVKIAVKAELDRAAAVVPLRERFAALRKQHPLPPPTGQAADKAFFDDLSDRL
jgi:antitoxin VapB